MNEDESFRRKTKKISSSLFSGFDYLSFDSSRDMYGIGVQSCQENSLKAPAPMKR